jgi:nucleotide-binding universal stress UspA family protein
LENLFKIVAAIDNSPYSSTVMKTVARIAAHLESDITILTVVKPRRYRTVDNSHGEDENSLADFHRHLIRKYFPTNTLELGTMSDRDSRTVPTQSATVHSKILEGDPANVICSQAESNDADLVVVGKRGERNVGALLLGSVSEKVVHKCTRSVLVAKGETRDHLDRAPSPYDLGTGSHSVSY